MYLQNIYETKSGCIRHDTVLRQSLKQCYNNVEDRLLGSLVSSLFSLVVELTLVLKLYRLILNTSLFSYGII